VTQEHAITVAQYLHSFKGYPGRAILDELINGRVVMSTEPYTAHALVRMNIYPLLDSACDGTDYEGFFRSNIQFPASNSAPAPDVCVVEKEPKLRYGHFEGSLLLAVEVLKPSEDVSEKVSLYLKESIASIWVVDIPRRIVLVYSGSEMRQYAEHTEIELPFPLKGSVRVDDVFSGLPESISDND
jgi:Uma2 family endonuclease